MVCFYGIYSISKFHFGELELRRGLAETDKNIYFKPRNNTNPTFFFFKSWAFFNRNVFNRTSW